MNHLIVALIIFVCVFCSALLGLYLRTLLPEHHLDDDSIDVVKLATGLIATMAVLVLGLLISSAKSSFDTVNASVTRDAVNVILLDRVLAQYGPQTQEIRGTLKQIVTVAVQQVASGDPAQQARLRRPEALERAEDLERRFLWQLCCDSGRRCPERKLLPLIRFRAAEFKDVTGFEEPDIFLRSVQVVRQHVEHAGNERCAHHTGLFA